MAERKFIPLEEGCDVMQKGITKLQNILEGLHEPKFTAEEHIQLYTTVYNMCTQKPPHNYALQLYNKYKEACEEYIISKVLPSLQEKKDNILLRELIKRWSNYKIMTKRLSRFFCYLDRRDISKLELPSLEETSMLSFNHMVYEEMNKEIMAAIFSMIDRKRAGEQIDRTFVINTLDFYLEFDECTRKNKAKEQKICPDILSKKINLISSDGVVFEVECGMALMSKKIEEIIDTIPVGEFESISIPLSSKMLTMVIEYCKKHNNTQKKVDLKDWDAQFIDVDSETLSDLEASARYLMIESLQKLVWKKGENLWNVHLKLFDLIKDKTEEEIAKFFALIKDKTPEEIALFFDIELDDLLKDKKTKKVVQFFDLIKDKTEEEIAKLLGLMKDKTPEEMAQLQEENK